MALITTTGSFIRQYNAFTGLSALERAQSGVARAEVVYYNVNDDWPAPGSGNNRLYQSGQIDLPKDFGYVLTDAFIRIESGSDRAKAEAVAHMRLYPGGVLGPQINLQLESDAGRQDGTGTTSIGSVPADQYNTNYPSFGDKGALVYALKDKTTAILYPFGSNTYTSTPNPASVWEFSIGEAALNGTNAYDVSCYVRFLQYDIDQSYNYVIQSPQLTR